MRSLPAFFQAHLPDQRASDNEVRDAFKRTWLTAKTLAEVPFPVEVGITGPPVKPVAEGGSNRTYLLRRLPPYFVEIGSHGRMHKSSYCSFLGAKEALRYVEAVFAHQRNGRDAQEELVLLDMRGRPYNGPITKGFRGSVCLQLDQADPISKIELHWDETELKWRGWEEQASETTIAFEPAATCVSLNPSLVFQWLPLLRLAFTQSRRLLHALVNLEGPNGSPAPLSYPPSPLAYAAVVAARDHPGNLTRCRTVSDLALLTRNELWPTPVTSTPSVASSYASISASVCVGPKVVELLLPLSWRHAHLHSHRAFCSVSVDNIIWYDLAGTTVEDRAKSEATRLDEAVGAFLMQVFGDRFRIGRDTAPPHSARFFVTHRVAGDVKVSWVPVSAAILAAVPHHQDVRVVSYAQDGTVLRTVELIRDAQGFVRVSSVSRRPHLVPVHVHSDLLHYLSPLAVVRYFNVMSTRRLEAQVAVEKETERFYKKTAGNVKQKGWSELSEGQSVTLSCQLDAAPLSTFSVAREGGLLRIESSGERLTVALPNRTPPISISGSDLARWIPVLFMAHRCHPDLAASLVAQYGGLEDPFGIPPPILVQLLDLRLQHPKDHYRDLVLQPLAEGTQAVGTFINDDGEQERWPAVTVAITFRDGKSNDSVVSLCFTVHVEEAGDEYLNVTVDGWHRPLLQASDTLNSIHKELHQGLLALARLVFEDFH